MFAFILPFVEGLVGPKFAKPLVYAALVALLIGLLGIAKCSYDGKIINTHDAKQAAATAVADKKADNHAADQRLADVTRRMAENTQTQKVIDEAKRTGADPRAAYYECVRKQQSARRVGQPSPVC